MYKLILTKEERSAIDFVGYRYSNGSDLYFELWVESELESPADCEGWDDCRDFTFLIPEHVAWKIRELAEQDDNLWPCFSDEFRDKMSAFVESIV